MAKIKNGDKVKIVRVGQTDWVNGMEEYIGTEGRVSSVQTYTSRHGEFLKFHIDTAPGWWWYSDACDKLTKSGKLKRITGLKGVAK